MRDIFYEIIYEALNGNVEIDGDLWPIGFNTSIEEQDIRLENDGNLSMLYIKDINQFLMLLEEYVEKELDLNRKCLKFYGDNALKSRIKFIISYLFINACTEEFHNPCDYIRRRIKFLDDTKLESFNDGITMKLGSIFKGSDLIIKNELQSVMMETPYKVTLTLTKDGSCYKLPEISYAICEEDGKDVCYIYSLLDKQEKEKIADSDLKYYKEVKRLLYKVNAGVKEEEGVVESIRDVSPSSVLSLFVFISLLKSKGITEIKGVPYLPLRYLSRRMAADNIIKIAKRSEIPRVYKVSSVSKRDESKSLFKERMKKRAELLKRNNDIQYNITNKFVRTFMRVAYHLDGFEVTAYPYEYDEYVHASIMEKNKDIDNAILDEVDNSIHL